MRPSARDHQFAAHLQRLADQGPRRALADLAHQPRRGETPSVRAIRWLAPCHGPQWPADWAWRHLVAGLFAEHPVNAPGSNLGMTMARIARVRGLTPSLENRFVALLEANADEVGGHLRRVVGLARAAQVPLDWAQLLADLRRWDDPLRPVQSEWARGFWASDMARDAQTGAGAVRANVG